VLHPPADCDFFQPAGGSGEAFLVVSALVPYKRIDLALEVFNRNRLPLRIVGDGPEFKRLRRLARSNVKLLGPLSDEDLLREYQNARALILPGEEDFGINAVEAQACGIPVIALGRGGARETVLDGKTGLLYTRPGREGLQGALDKFQGMAFNKKLIRENAERFSRDRFKEKASAYFRRKWSEFTERHDPKTT
jgi:glycosyltransferase involved in cell wall biosynthesis